MVSSSSTKRRISWTRGRISSSGTPSSTRRYATFSPTVIESKSAPSWNTNPTFCRKASKSCSLIDDTGLLRSSTSPLSGRINPAASFRVSVLPVPVSPRRMMVSRVRAVNETPLRMSPSLKPRWTSRNEMTADDSECRSRFWDLADALIAGSENLVCQVQRKFGQKCIRYDDEHG